MLSSYVETRVNLDLYVYVLRLYYHLGRREKCPPLIPTLLPLPLPVAVVVTVVVVVAMVVVMLDYHPLAFASVAIPYYIVSDARGATSSRIGHKLRVCVSFTIISRVAAITTL